MIRVDSTPYIGCTAQSLVVAETSKKIYGDLFSQPFYLTINGHLIEEEEFTRITIGKGDQVQLVPLYAGG